MDKTEYYTPKYIIEAVRRTLGPIELDPASCEKANEIVQAERFFTKDDDALKQDWSCRTHRTLWMNHPYQRDLNKPFIEKLIDSYNSRCFFEAICITENSTSENWFQPLLKFKQCFLSKRVSFYHKGNPTGTPRCGHVVTYLCRSPGGFERNFRDLGHVK